MQVVITATSKAIQTIGSLYQPVQQLQFPYYASATFTINLKINTRE